MGEAASGGAPAARGCSIEEEKMLFVGGGSRCAGLLDCKWKEAASRGSSAARGCWIEQWGKLLLRELPLRGHIRPA